MDVAGTRWDVAGMGLDRAGFEFVAGDLPTEPAGKGADWHVVVDGLQEPSSTLMAYLSACRRCCHPACM